MQHTVCLTHQANFYPYFRRNFEKKIGKICPKNPGLMSSAYPTVIQRPAFFGQKFRKNNTKISKKKTPKFPKNIKNFVKNTKISPIRH